MTGLQGAQQRGARRVDRITRAGPPRLSHLPVLSRVRPPEVPRVCVHRQHGGLRSLGSAACRRAAPCPRCPIRSPHADPTSTTRRSRTACTCTGSRHSTGSATRALGPTWSTSRRAAPSPTRATCHPPRQCCHISRPPERRAASTSLGGRHSTRPPSRAMSSSGASRTSLSGRYPAYSPSTSFTDVTARRGVDYFYLVQAIDHAGTLSEPSPPLLHRY